MKLILLILVLITRYGCIHAGYGDNQTPNGAMVILCLPGEFQCESKDQCILELRRCDGIPDCRDKSDEMNCVSELSSSIQRRPISLKLPGVGPTSEDGYRKLDRPIWPTFIFNLSNSSLVSSPISIFSQESITDCTKNEFRCNGKCFPSTIICNGFKECNNGSDEKDCSSISATLEPRTEESSTHPPTTTYATTQQGNAAYSTMVQPITTTKATITQPSTTTKKPALTWKVNQTADGLPMEKQQLAIDRVVEAFAKYSETDYFNIAQYIVNGFEDKYKTFKWNCVINTDGIVNNFSRYEPPNWIRITRDDGAMVRVWRSPD